MADPDLQIRGGGGASGHPDPEITGGGGDGQILRPFGPQFGPKMPLERAMGQRGNLRALAGIYEFH